MPPPPPEEEAANFLEYPTFRIPYEELNQVYHNGHKRIQRASVALKKTSDIVKSHIPTTGNEYVKVSEIADLFDKVIQRTQELRQAVKRAHDDEGQIIDTMKKRVELIDTEQSRHDSKNSLEVWRGRRDRTCRLAANYMLRCGRIETAKALADRLGIADCIDLDIFQRGKYIEQQLLLKNTAPCIQWMAEHHNGLRHIPSRLELQVRIQDAVTLLRAKKVEQALDYAKKHLSIKDYEVCDDLPKLWGLFGFGIETTIAPYGELLREERWRKLGDMFKEEFAALYKLPYHSAFGICIQCGLSAFKTPECAPGKNDRCVTCQSQAYALAEGLPYSHAGNSSILCSISGEPMNEDNPPMMLPNGRVYGLRSLERLCENGRIRCPNGGQIFPMSECTRVYIL